MTVIPSAPLSSEPEHKNPPLRVPRMVTGTMGAPVSHASLNAPSLNSPSSPVLERVPSGKMQTGTPCLSRERQRAIIAVWLRPVLSPRLSMTWPVRNIDHPMKGTRNMDCLDTNLKGYRR